MALKVEVPSHEIVYHLCKLESVKMETGYEKMAKSLYASFL